MPGGEALKADAPAVFKAEHVGIAGLCHDARHDGACADDFQVLHIPDHKARPVIAGHPVVVFPGVGAVARGLAQIIDAVFQINGGVRANGGQQLVHRAHMDHAVLGGRRGLDGGRLRRGAPLHVLREGEGLKRRVLVCFAVRVHNALARAPLLVVPAIGAGIVLKGAAVHRDRIDRA